MMSVRNVVKIDTEKCTGCGLCAQACAEGAIQIVEGKARLVSDSYCDGLGACLGHCPEGAITIEQREAGAFDEQAVARHLARPPKHPWPPSGNSRAAGTPSMFVCPGLAAQQLRKADRADDSATGDVSSQLTHWPVQLRLVAPTAPYFADADLLLVADCVPFAMGDFHQRFLKGHRVVIGCPKLDDAGFYIEKLAQILSSNNLRSLTVIHMEVPCCSGLTRIAREALARSGRTVDFREVTISLQGAVL
jgi:Pyruvate/2-oxoacid:ferredoxin oxidoreductase delta subunit